MKTVFTQDWKDWIHTNVNAGRDRDGIFKILLDEGMTLLLSLNKWDIVPHVRLGS